MTELPKSARIFVAGHRGLVGSAILRALEKEGYPNLLTATREQLDLRDQAAVNYWFKANRPEYVFLVAGTVGGILANSSRPAEFIYDNMMIHATVVHAAYLYGIKKLLYLGSSCIYPRECPQPMKEEYLLSGWLEPTNESYAIAKIAGIKLCQAYRKQYGCNFISAMPTNLYGPGDNFDLLSSHVLPALIRKFHLAKLACQGDWEGIERDEVLFGPIPSDLRQSLGRPSTTQDKNSLPQADPVGLNLPLSPVFRGRSLGNAPLRDSDKDNAPLSALCELERSGREKKDLNSELQTPQSGIRAATEDFRYPVSSIQHQESVVIWGTGSPRREFLHVDDLASACLFIMDRYDDLDHINVGTGQDQTIGELAELVREFVFPEARIVYDSEKPDGTPLKLLDVSRLKDLGWGPEVDFRQGIKTTYAWYLSQTR
jgi:nucleoside-diphosphate-sugar epimerase